MLTSLNKGLFLLTATALLATAATARPEVRDPFVNQKTPFTPSTVQSHNPRPNQPPTVQASQPGKPTQVTQGQVDKVIAPPEAVVSGIVTSRGTRQAILSTGQQSYMVREGQKLGDFKVRSISADSVTLVCEGQSFKLPLTKGM